MIIILNKLAHIISDILFYLFFASLILLYILAIVFSLSYVCLGLVAWVSQYYFIPTNIIYVLGIIGGIVLTVCYFRFMWRNS